MFFRSRTCPLWPPRISIHVCNTVIMTTEYVAYLSSGFCCRACTERCFWGWGCHAVRRNTKQPQWLCDALLNCAWYEVQRAHVWKLAVRVRNKDRDRRGNEDSEEHFKTFQQIAFWTSCSYRMQRSLLISAHCPWISFKSQVKNKSGSSADFILERPQNPALHSATTLLCKISEPPTFENVRRSMCKSMQTNDSQ